MAGSLRPRRWPPRLGTDVWPGPRWTLSSRKPLSPSDPLLGLDNIIFTPHIASHTEEAITRLAVGCAEHVLAVLEGRRPASIANPDVWRGRRGADNL